MTKNTKHFRYMLTINNPAPAWTHENIIRALSQLKLKYWAMADEQGLEENTPHTHLYFVAERSQIRFDTVKKLFPTAHIEPARATSEECRAYIQKSGKWYEDQKADTSIEGTFEEWGELPVESQGKRTDWDMALEMLEEGSDVLTVIRMLPHMARYRTTLMQIKQDLIFEEFQDEFRKLDITFVQGVTGLGKTRLVMERYGYRNVCRVTKYQKGGFDHYRGQDILLMDEFASSYDIQELNTLLDGYPVWMDARYSDKAACYTKIYIASNIPLEQQYPKIKAQYPTVWDAFIRRINKVLVFSDLGEYDEYTTKEYLDSVRRKPSDTWVEVEKDDDCPFDKNNGGLFNE